MFHIFGNMNSHLKDILTLMAKAEIKFIVCGGVALVLHGVERMTLDLDVSVDLEKNNLQKMLDLFTSTKLQPRAPVSSDILLEPAQRSMLVEQKHALVFSFIDIDSPYRQVDIFLTDELSYDNLIDYSEIIQIDEAKINVLTTDKLLELKSNINPPRDKDSWDIKELLKLINSKYEIKESNSKVKEQEQTYEALKPEEFDGHTDFHKLTPEQKLMWLSQSAQFYYDTDVVNFRNKMKTENEMK
jgi:hypothetical protein